MLFGLRLVFFFYNWHLWVWYKPSDERKMKMDRSKLLLHQVVLSVSSVTEQDFMNTSISVVRVPLELPDKA